MIFLPDVWSIMPTTSEFAQLEKEYAEALEVKLHPELVKAKVEEETKKKEKENVEAMVSKKMRARCTYRASYYHASFAPGDGIEG